MNVLAVDIGGTAIKSALTDEKGHIMDAMETPSDGKAGGAALLERLYGVIEQYKDYSLIGVSTAGQVDGNTGLILYANDNIPGYTGTQVKSLLQSRYGVPVAVGNDVNCAALGEAFYGAGKEFADFLCLTYGTGIGGAILTNRQIYGGAHGLAGEFGHIITHPQDGVLCTCGQKGCYEQYASVTALVKRCVRINPACRDGRLVFREMESGNARIREAVDGWIDEILPGLVTLVHSFDPSCVILGGGIMNENYILQEINCKIYDMLIPSYRGTVFKRAQLGNHAGLLGATRLALHATF